MTNQQHKLQARRVYDVLTQAIRTGNMSLLDEVFAADVIDHNPAPAQAPGVAGLKQTFRAIRTAFPDLYFSAEDQVAEGDQVVSRVINRGTHKGDFLEIPATGKSITQEGIDIVRLANGKVVERWGVFDNLILLQQIGAVPMAAQRT